jgi:hypothetical protein
MTVHLDPCRSIQEHVELEMSDPQASFPRLPDFVAGVVRDWEAERSAPDPIDCAKRMAELGWAPGEYTEAYGR